MIYDALGFPRPVFGHVSLILAPDKSKLSKRCARARACPKTVKRTAIARACLATRRSSWRPAREGCPRGSQPFVHAPLHGPHTLLWLLLLLLLLQLLLQQMPLLVQAH